MAVLASVSASLLTGCATPRAVRERPAEEVRTEIVRRMPAGTRDAEGWAADIQAAFAAQSIDPGTENICAVLAIAAQESGLQADPVVPGLPQIARAEIDRRAAAVRIPAFVVSAALAIASPDGRSFDQRLRAVRTERELSALYDEIIGAIPLGRMLFGGLNPVHTGGPMQVSIAFAESHRNGYPYPVQTSIRNEVFTRRGGLYFGIAHLLGYRTPYARKLHRFADYNAGWYASRNAAFQNAVAVASANVLVLDGDLLQPGAALESPGKTELALRKLRPRLDMDDRAIRSALGQADTLEFGDTPLYQQVFARADAVAGKPLPRAMVPDIRLESPKISRPLTTAWFAERVDQRYQACMQKT